MGKNDSIFWILGLVAVVGLGWCFVAGPCKRFIPGQLANVEFDEAAQENKRRIEAGLPKLTPEEFAARTPHAKYMPAAKTVKSSYAYYY